MAPRASNTANKESPARAVATQAKQTIGQKSSPARMNRFQTSNTDNATAQNDVNMFSTNTGDLVFSCFGRRTGLPTWLKYHVSLFQNDERAGDMIMDPRLNIHVFGTERMPPPQANTSFKSYFSKPDPTKPNSQARSAVNILFVRFKVKEGEFDDRLERDRIHRNFVRVMNILGAHTNTAHQYKQTFKVGTVSYGGSSPNLGDILDPDTFLKGLYFAKHYDEDHDEGNRRDKIEELRAAHDDIVQYFGMASYAQFLITANIPVPQEYSQQLALADENRMAQITNNAQSNYTSQDIGLE